MSSADELQLTNGGVAQGEDVVIQRITAPDDSTNAERVIDLYAYERAEGAPKRPAWFLAMRPEKRMCGWLYWWYLLLWKLADICKLYRLKSRNGNPMDLKVRKNKRIRIPYYIGSKRKAIDMNMRFIRYVRDQLVMTVGVVSRKGGVFKTGLVMWLGAIFAMATNNQCGAVDFDSTANKAMLQRGGKPEYYNTDGHTGNVDLNAVIEGVLNHKWQPTSTDVHTLFPRHDQTGLYMVSPTTPTHTTESETMQVLTALNRVFPTCLVDTAPGEKEVNTVAVMHLADVLLLVDEDNPEGWDRIKAFRKGFCGANGESFDAGLDSGKFFIVISQVPMDRYNQRHRYALAHELNVRASQLVLIPEDTYVKEVKTLDLHRTGKHFEFAMSSFAVQIANSVIHGGTTSHRATNNFAELSSDDLVEAARLLIKSQGSRTAASRFLAEVDKK